MSFEQALQEKLGKHNPAEVRYIQFLSLQIQELILDNVFKFDKLTEDHKNSMEKYTSLIHLSMNGLGLLALENFPNLPELQIVSLIIII